MVTDMEMIKRDIPAGLENDLLSANIEKILTGFKKAGIPAAKKGVNIASMIDHTILKPEATPEEIVKLCSEAKQYKFASVCVNPSYVSLCFELLKGSEVKVCTVIGFPLGAATTESKVYEAEQAIQNGAGEVDMVLNIGRLKQGDNGYAYNDIFRVVQAAKKGKAVTKVILETCLLNDEEKVKACLICKYAGADFVKTSTGFSKGGATTADVALMKFVVGKNMSVKASGGIRTRKDADGMIAAGADRIGASAGIAIVEG
jgi:deoxyribose-phosphate aldolase